MSALFAIGDAAHRAWLDAQTEALEETGWTATCEWPRRFLHEVLAEQHGTWAWADHRYTLRREGEPPRYTAEPYLDETTVRATPELCDLRGFGWHTWIAETPAIYRESTTVVSVRPPTFHEWVELNGHAASDIGSACRVILVDKAFPWDATLPLRVRRWRERLGTSRALAGRCIDEYRAVVRPSILTARPEHFSG